MIRFTMGETTRVYMDRKFRTYEWFMPDETPLSSETHIFVLVRTVEEKNGHIAYHWGNGKYMDGKYWMYDVEEDAYKAIEREELLFWTSELHRAFPYSVAQHYAHSGKLLDLGRETIWMLQDIERFDEAIDMKEREGVLLYEGGKEDVEEE